MMPIKLSSPNTGWNKTNARIWLLTFTQLKKMLTQSHLKMIPGLQHSDLSVNNHSNNSNNSAHSNNTTIEETDPGANLPTGATATDQTKVPTQPETVNSAFTAKFLTTPKKSAAKELMIKSLV